MMARGLPIVYVLAHTSLFCVEYWEWDCIEDTYTLTQALGILDVAFTPGLIFAIWINIASLLTSKRKCLFIPASAAILVFSSYPKLRDVGWRHGVETFVRFALSLLMGAHLKFKNMIVWWQVVLFSVMVTICGVLEIYFFCHMDLGVYTGRRINIEARWLSCGKKTQNTPNNSEEESGNRQES